MAALNHGNSSGAYAEGRQTGTTVSVHAGFPNPAAERSGAPLSLDKLLIRHPSSTFFFRIRGHNWFRYGVFDGDLAIIDRALVPRSRDLVVWWQESGDFMLSSFSRTTRRDQIWGTITAIVHPFGAEE
ncbi:MAG TPA: S24 family peptidase [Candidatus Saccharimonadales bacterium]|nr:S24 family peptidase [Candidatus Saccharimonadales bacterium]